MRLAPSGFTLVLIASLAACTAAPSPTSDPSASPTGSSSATPESSVTSIYYPVAQGNTWVYSIDYGSGTTVTDTEVMTVVVPEGDGSRVTFDRTFHWEDDSQPDLKDTVDYVFAADGSLTVPFQSIPSAGGIVTVTSGTMVWPTSAEFEAGTAKTGRIEASVENAGTTTKEVVDFAIVGSGTEAVTVPAGSYTARKLSQALVISLPDLGVEGITVNAITWLVEDVGPVQTVVPDMSGTTITQVLVSFTPGR